MGKLIFNSYVGLPEGILVVFGIIWSCHQVMLAKIGLSVTVGFMVYTWCSYKPTYNWGGTTLLLLMNEVNLSNLIWSQLIMCSSGRTTVLCFVSCWTCSHPFFLPRTVSCRNSNGFYMLYYPIYSNIIYIYMGMGQNLLFSYLGE